MIENVLYTSGRAKILTPKEIETVSGGAPRMGGQISHASTVPRQIRQAPTPAPATQETTESQELNRFDGIGSFGDIGFGGFGGIGGFGGTNGS